MKLVRKKIILESANKGTLSFNYYYNLMKELYRCMTEVDKEKSLNLHELGYVLDGNKRFKLFNYNLIIENVETNEQGLQIYEKDTIKLVLSGVAEVVNLIIKGLIKKEYITLNDLKLQVVDMNDDSKIRFNNIMLYKTRTPVVESIYDKENKRAYYLNPLQQDYYKALGQNLLRKYKLVYKKDYEGELYFDIENTLNIKKKFIKGVKKGYLIGYQDFEMYIQADYDMQKIAYHLGVGQNNSLGMGHLSYITGRRF